MFGLAFGLTLVSDKTDALLSISCLAATELALHVHSTAGAWRAQIALGSSCCADFGLRFPLAVSLSSNAEFVC